MVVIPSVREGSAFAFRRTLLPQAVFEREATNRMRSRGKKVQAGGVCRAAATYVSPEKSHLIRSSRVLPRSEIYVFLSLLSALGFGPVA
jgi:hypothetical protein